MKALMVTVAGFSRKTEDIENDLEDAKDTTEVLREKCINLCAATNKFEDKIAVLQQKIYIFDDESFQLQEDLK